MNPRELVDHIRSGPADSVLKEPLRFHRRTRSNPCDFNEFLQALQSSETIRTMDCMSLLHVNKHTRMVLTTINLYDGRISGVGCKEQFILQKGE